MEKQSACNRCSTQPIQSSNYLVLLSCIKKKTHQEEKGQLQTMNTATLPLTKQVWAFKGKQIKTTILQKFRGKSISLAQLGC